MNEIKDMCIDDRRVIACIELCKIIARLEKSEYMIQVGAHQEETAAVMAARKAVWKAREILYKRIETKEGKGMWPINVRFDDEGNFQDFDFGTQNGWARCTINDKDGYDGLINSVPYDIH